MGLFLMFVGLIIRLVAIKQLKLSCFWRVFPPPFLVTDGIYKYIRHPLYLGGFLIGLGLSLFLCGWKVAVVAGYIIFHFFLDRADREEQLLVIKFGERYLNYINKTKMFIPMVF